MCTFLFALWLVFPAHTDDVNTDGCGLFYNISPFLPEKGTLHLLAKPWLSYGARPHPIHVREYRDIPNLELSLPVDYHFYGSGIFGLGYTLLPQLQIFIANYSFGAYIQRRPYPLERSDTRYIAYPQILTAVKTGFPAKLGNYDISFGFVFWYAQWLAMFYKENPNPVFWRDRDPKQPGIQPPTQPGDDGGFLNFDPIRPEVHDMEFGIRGITAFKSPFGTTFLNLGYFHIISETKIKDRSFNSFGFGQEFDMWKYVHFGVEYAQQDTIASFIPQLKFLLPYVTLNLGLGIPLFNGDWVPDDTLHKTPKLMVSLSPHITIRRKLPPKPTIVVRGRVYDSLSTMPLPATITFIGPISGKIETKKNGEYELKFLKAGSYRVGVETADFNWEERVFHLMEYDTVWANWPLLRKCDWSIAGKILDKQTKKGVPAIVRLLGKDKAETFSDPATGEYRLWVHTGKYKLHVDADGYHSEVMEIDIPNVHTLTKDIYLTPKELPKRATPPPKKGEKKPTKKKVAKK